MGESMSERMRRKSKMVADAVLEKEYVLSYVLWRAFQLISSRRDRPVGQTFGAGFLWPEAVDAAADVYNGVRSASVAIS